MLNRRKWSLRKSNLIFDLRTISPSKAAFENLLYKISLNKSIIKQFISIPIILFLSIIYFNNSASVLLSNNFEQIENSEIKYSAYIRDAVILMKHNSVVFSFPNNYMGNNMELRFNGCNPMCEIIKETKRDLTISAVIYKDIYKGIDARFYFNQQTNCLKYDLIINPGSEPSDIELEWIGANHLLLSENGKSIDIQGDLMRFREQDLYVYQNSDKSNESISIAASFKLSSNKVKFNIGHFNRSQKLIIDPNVFWSTYYGGNDGDHGITVTSDHKNDIICTGNTLSYDYPVSAGAYSTKRGNSGFDGFLSKFDASGVPIWSTYFGGTGTDYGIRIINDRTNNLYLTGLSWSNDFPTTPNAFQISYGGGQNDAFVSKFDRLGQLIWSSYLGGDKGEHGLGIAIDSTSNLAVTGWTISENFPVSVNSFQNTLHNKDDAFLVLMDTNGVYQWGTYFGGDSTEWGLSVAFDRSDNVLLGGWTTSPNFPTKRDTLEKSKAAEKDGYIAKFDITGNLIYSKLIGGSDLDDVTSIATDNLNRIYTVGSTGSKNFPIAGNTFQKKLAGRLDGFLAVLDSDFFFVFSTYYGGSLDDVFKDVALDNKKNILVVGHTYSTDFPTTEASLQEHFNGGVDAVVVKFNPDAKSVFWSSYLGGSAGDWSGGIAADDSIGVIVVGETQGADFPVSTIAAQKNFGGIVDVFLAKFCATCPNPKILKSGTTSFCSGDSVILSLSQDYIHYYWSDGETSKSITVKSSGTFTAMVVDSVGCSNTAKPVSVIVFPNPKPEIIGNDSFCDGDSVVLKLRLKYSSYLWSNMAMTDSIVVKNEGNYLVGVRDSNGCTGFTQFFVKALRRPKPVINGRKSVCPFTKTSKYATEVNDYADYQWHVNGSATISNYTDASTAYFDFGKSGSATIYVTEIDRTTKCSASSNTIVVNISNSLTPNISTNKPDLKFCPDDSITLFTDEDYSKYQWSSGETSKSITVKQAGMYIVSVKDDQGCSGSDTINVSNYSLPVSSISGENLTCFGNVGLYKSDNNKGLSYLWTVSGGKLLNKSDSNAVFILWNSLPAGTLTLIATDKLTGCTSLPIKYLVNISAVPIVKLKALSKTDFCDGDSVYIESKSPYMSYLWSTKETNQRISVKNSGLYWVNIIDSNNCIGTSDTIQIKVHPIPPKPNISISGDTLISDSAYYYQWIKDGININGENRRRLISQGVGKYRVRINNEFSCENISDIYEIIKLKASATISLPDTILTETDKIITLPLAIIKQKNLTKALAKDFDAFFTYNNSILLPLEPFTNISTSKYISKIKIRSTATDTIGKFAEFSFQTAWGNTECSELKLDSLSFLNPDIEISIINNSVICITNLCKAGGITRLFYSSPVNLYFQVSPNPAEESLKINFSSIVNGEGNIFLRDMIGNKLITIFTGQLEQGIYEINHDLWNIPNGQFLLIYQTPDTQIVRLIQIIK
ncbi:MAG: SBBP repeat-containing protein [Candidatus Kapabacteria bacterium]|nr:SBBP repeat-containing protein [Candidatus Kapabacteria bacterium]